MQASTPCSAKDDCLASAGAAYLKLVEEERHKAFPDLPHPEMSEAKDAVLSGASLAEYVAQLKTVGNKCLAQFLLPAQSLAVCGGAILKGIDARLTRIEMLLAQTSMYSDEVTDKRPWTTLDVIAAIMLIVVSVLLLGTDLNTVATVLVASGVPGMDDKPSAMMWSFVPVGLAIALKSMIYAAPSDLPKRRYTVGVWVFGVMLSIVWTLLFPRCFDPHLGQSTGQIIASASSAADGPSSSMGAWFITIGMLCSGLLAGGCWLTLDAIAAAHRVSRRSVHPLYKRAARDQAALGKWRTRIDLAKGRIDGRVKSIESALARQRKVRHRVRMDQPRLQAPRTSRSSFICDHSRRPGYLRREHWCEIRGKALLPGCPQCRSCCGYKRRVVEIMGVCRVAGDERRRHWEPALRCQRLSRLWRIHLWPVSSRLRSEKGDTIIQL